MGRYRPTNGRAAGPRWGAAVVVLLTSCATFRPAGTPAIGVRVSGSSEAATLAPYYCDDPATSPRISRIIVLEVVNGGTPDRVARCELVAAGSGSERLPTPWTYGAKVPGFNVGTCEGLARGKTYVIQVVGGGAGSETFAVGPDGALTTIRRDPCGMNR